MAIPPPHIDIEELTPQDYEIKEVMFGKPMLETTTLIVTKIIKEFFRHLEQDGAELITLWRENKILKLYLSEVVGPLDPTNLKESLNTTLERRDNGIV